MIIIHAIATKDLIPMTWKGVQKTQRITWIFEKCHSTFWRRLQFFSTGTTQCGHERMTRQSYLYENGETTDFDLAVCMKITSLLGREIDAEPPSCESASFGLDNFGSDVLVQDSLWHAEECTRLTQNRGMRRQSSMSPSKMFVTPDNITTSHAHVRGLIRQDEVQGKRCHEKHFENEHMGQPESTFLLSVVLRSYRCCQGCWERHGHRNFGVIQLDGELFVSRVLHNKLDFCRTLFLVFWPGSFQRSGFPLNSLAEWKCLSIWRPKRPHEAGQHETGTVLESDEQKKGKMFCKRKTHWFYGGENSQNNVKNQKAGCVLGSWRPRVCYNLSFRFKEHFERTGNSWMTFAIGNGNEKGEVERVTWRPKA